MITKGDVQFALSTFVSLFVGWGVLHYTGNMMYALLVTLAWMLLTVIAIVLQGPTGRHIPARVETPAPGNACRAMIYRYGQDPLTVEYVGDITDTADEAAQTALQDAGYEPQVIYRATRKDAKRSMAFDARNRGIGDGVMVRITWREPFEGDLTGRSIYYAVSLPA